MSSSRQPETSYAALQRYGSKALTFFTKPLQATYAYLSAKYPAECHMDGVWIFGRLLEVFSTDGRGLDRIIVEAGKKAQENNGIAWWHFGPVNVALVVNPEDIKTVAVDNVANVETADGSDSFTKFFGADTIFSKKTGSAEHNEDRKRFLHLLFIGSTLRNDVPKMLGILDDYITNIENTDDPVIPDLETYANSVTMDMISTKLGFKHIEPEDKKAISEIIGKATCILASGYHQLLYPLMPWIDQSKTELGRLLDEGHVLLRKIIKYNEDNMLNTANLLTLGSSDHWANSQPKAVVADDLYKIESLNEIKQFIVAGHETTTKLLMSSLMLLADSNHSAVVEKLRKEVDGLKLSPSDLARNEIDIKKLPYMQAVMDEALRLYPPIPDMVFKIEKSFSFANDQCHLPADSVVFISPRITGWSKQVWGEDADKFDPERFVRLHRIMAAQLSDLTDAEKEERKLYPSKHFPFGFKPRPCPGQNFSRQEVALLVARLVSKFDLQLMKDNEPLHHPFDFHQIFTLHFGLKDVQLKLTRRAGMEEQMQNDAEEIRPLSPRR